MSMRTKLPVDLRVLGETQGDAFGERGVLGQAHLGELDADVGVEFARGDQIEKLMVDVCGAFAPRRRSRRFRRASRG